MLNQNKQLEKNWNKIPIENCENEVYGPYIMEYNNPDNINDALTFSCKLRTDLSINELMTKDNIGRIERKILWGKWAIENEYKIEDDWVGYSDISHHILNLKEIDNEIIVTAETIPTPKGLELKRIIELGFKLYAVQQYFKDSLPNINILIQL